MRVLKWVLHLLALPVLGVAGLLVGQLFTSIEAVGLVFLRMAVVYFIVWQRGTAQSKDLWYDRGEKWRDAEDTEDGLRR